MEISFKELKATDIETCLSIMKENYPSEEDKHWHNLLPNDLTDILNQKYPSQCLVVLLGEVPVGFGCYIQHKEKTNLQENIYALTWINILPKEQGKGIGKQLVIELEECISIIELRNYHIILETDKPTFYQKLGYKTFKKNKGNDVMDKYFMAPK